MARAETAAVAAAKTTSSVHAVLAAVSIEPIESIPKAIAVSVHKTLRDTPESSNPVAIAAAASGLALALVRVHEEDGRWSLPRPVVFFFTIFAVVSRAVRLRASALLSFQKWPLRRRQHRAATAAASTRVPAADAIALAGAAIVRAQGTSR